MKELYLQLTTVYEHYRGTGKLLILFLVAVLVIYLAEKRDQNGRQQVYPAFFLLSIWTGIAYAASSIADFFFLNEKNTEKTEKRKISVPGVLALLFCIVVLSLNGTRIISNSYFEKAQNTMHIRTEYVQVMDAILERTSEPRVIAPPGLAPYLKMYSSGFITMYDYPANGDISLLDEDARTVYEQLSGSIPDMKKVADIAKENNFEYIILNSQKYYPEFPITMFGYELIDTAGDWEVYREERGNGI